MNEKTRAASKISPLRAARERVNAEQWLEQADARERQPPRHFIDRGEVERPGTTPLADRWWFRTLVVLALLLLQGSLYVLSCGANPFGTCTL